MDPFISIGVAVLSIVVSGYIWSQLKRWANDQYEYMKEWVANYLDGYGGWFGKSLRSGWAVCCYIGDAIRWGLGVAAQLYDYVDRGYSLLAATLAELRVEDGLLSIYEPIPQEEIPRKVLRAIESEGAYKIQL